MLIIIVLSFHLLSVLLASALPLLSIAALGIKPVEEVDQSVSTARHCVKIALHSLLGGILLGLLVAGLMWVGEDRAYFDVLPRFLYKIKWGIAELLFTFICYGLYLFWLPRSEPATRRRQLVLGFIAVLGATNLLYHFPPLFTSIRLVSEAPTQFPAEIGPSEFRQIWTQSHAVPMLVHFALASLVAAGIYLTMHLTRPVSGQGPMTNYATRLARTSSGVALTATAAQMLVGTWLLLSLPPSTQRLLIGGDLVRTLSLLASIALTFSLMHDLSAAAFGDLKSPRTKRSMSLLVLLIVLMTATR